jgi:Mismatch repair ATPase (MutS family)
MKQYFAIKAKYPDAVLLFRVGDFYETFGEDAVTASKVLGIVLTRRANGTAMHVELAGFPHHSIDSYLPKLVRAGYRVAVCDQLEDPKLTKKIVKRGITELVTPGVAYNDQLLSNKEHNYLAALCFAGQECGVAFLDISTGSFKVASGSLDYIDLLLSSLSPKELLMEKSLRKGFEERFGKEYYISGMDEWPFVASAAHEKLREQFGVNSLKGFGIDSMPLATTAAGAILFYLELTHHEGLKHLCNISRIDEGEFVWIDRFTFHNLEIFGGAQEDSVSLIKTIDRTATPMGARALRSWLAMPLKNINELNSRLNAVDSLYANDGLRQSIRDLMHQIGDLERMVSRAAAGKLSPREAATLRNSIRQITPLKDICANSGKNICAENDATNITTTDITSDTTNNTTNRPTGDSTGASNNLEIIALSDNLDPCSALLKYMAQHLLPDPAGQIGKGDVIAPGVSQELDSLRQIARHGKDILNDIQARESERTGISSLKISYNNVFGYYLEVRNTHKDKVPSDWIRKQTLVSAERYITQELKEYEEKILGAEEKILALEQQLFNEIILAIQQQIPAIQQNASVISKLDCLAAFALLAKENRYVKPRLNLGNIIDIKGGRHPVIETLMKDGEEYVPNDLLLDSDSQQIIILTGPNMSGKSALLRQTALIVLLAQIGCFVPAEGADIGVVDKIFTRVGASDNISRGESTFMVEMLETSTILHNLSPRSLILLDEIGRGTSTYDGMSIAWAIVEYIHEHPEYRAKTLFATHYHELNDLELKFVRVNNWHISVKEVGNKVIFLRKLCPGGVEHSFGIHVARMAGMPREVVTCAERVLKQLENRAKTSRNVTEATNGTSLTAECATEETTENPAKNAQEGNPIQLSFFQLDDPLLEELRDELKKIDINTMSPLDAFDKLRSLKKKLKI